MRRVCGAVTVDGSLCQNPPGCRAAHPAGPPGATPGAGPGVGPTLPVDPLAAPATPPAPFGDPREPGADIAAWDDASLAYAAANWDVDLSEADGDGWRDVAVASLRDKVARCPPLHWSPVDVAWSWYADRESNRGVFGFAADPDVVACGDDFRLAVQAAALEEALADVDQARMMMLFNWGDVSFTNSDIARRYGVLMYTGNPDVNYDRPAGHEIVFDDVDHDETILSLEEDDPAAARTIEAVAARWPELGARARRAFLPITVANDPGTDAGTLAELAGDPDPGVRAAAAGNPNCPPAARAAGGLLSD